MSNISGPINIAWEKCSWAWSMSTPAVSWPTNSSYLINLRPVKWY